MTIYHLIWYTKSNLEHFKEHKTKIKTAHIKLQINLWYKIKVMHDIHHLNLLKKYFIEIIPLPMFIN